MSEHLEKLLEQTSALRAPLTGDAPGGSDIALEPEFEAIKAELDKLSSLDGGTVDWAFVVARAEELLTTKTKDLRLAVWLTAAGLEHSGWSGLARGLVVCRSLATELWEVLLPKRDKARANIVGWLSERTPPTIQSLQVRLEDGDDVHLCVELAQTLDRAMADKLGDAFSGIRGLVSAIRSRVADIPEPPPPPQEVIVTEAPSQSASEDASAAPVAAAPPTNGVYAVAIGARAADAEVTTKMCGDALVALARAIAQTDPTRAWAYRLHRCGIWLPFERIWVNAGVLDLPGPDAEVVERLHGQFASSGWAELAVSAEDATARFPLWLDPHRLLAIALERLGTAYHEAREVVGRDTTDFVRRHPLLLKARFADGQLAVSPEAAEWLELETSRWQVRPRPDDVGRDEDRDLAVRFAEAKNLVAAGRPLEGLGIAAQLARRGSDPRERFRASLDVARLAMHAGAYDVARPILEGLMGTVQAHSLEGWEPSLCVRLYAGLYRCLPEDSPERPKVFESLCRLDPSAAMRARGAPADAPTTRAPTRGAASSTPNVNGVAFALPIAAVPGPAAAPPSLAVNPAEAPAPVPPEQEPDDFF
jgi:type VI secretion system protein VasJ